MTGAARPPEVPAGTAATPAALEPVRAPAGPERDRTRTRARYRWHPATAASAAVSIAGLSALPWCCGFQAAGPLLAAAAAAPLAALARTGGLRAWATIVAAAWLPLAISSLVVHGLFTPGAEGALADLGPFRLTAGGLDTGWRYAGRLFILVAAGALFGVAAPPSAALAAIGGRPWSADGQLALEVALNTLPVARRRAASILEAQRARGLRLDGSPLRRLAAARALVVPLALGLLLDAEIRARALDLRGARIRGARIRLRELPDGPRQRRVRRALPAVIAAVVVAARLAVA